MSVRVFPVPAPAMMSSGPSPKVAAAACSGLSSDARSRPRPSIVRRAFGVGASFVNTRFRHARNICADRRSCRCFFGAPLPKHVFDCPEDRDVEGRSGYAAEQL